TFSSSSALIIPGEMNGRSSSTNFFTTNGRRGLGITGRPITSINASGSVDKISRYHSSSRAAFCLTARRSLASSWISGGTYQTAEGWQVGFDGLNGQEAQLSPTSTPLIVICGPSPTARTSSSDGGESGSWGMLAKSSL